MKHSTDQSAAPTAPRATTFRRTGLVGMASLSVAVLLSIVPSGVDRPAGGDTLSDARAQASAVAAKIQATDQRLQMLTDQYTAADYRLSQLGGQIAQTERQVAVDQAAVAQNQKALRNQALADYTSSGTHSQVTDLFTSDRNVAGIRAEYSRLAAGNLATLIANLHASVAQLSAVQAGLQQQQVQASNARSTLASARNQTSTLVAQEQATKAGLDANIQALVAQQQAAASAAAAAAFTARVHAAQASATVTAQSTAATPGSTGSTDPTRGSGTTSGPKAPSTPATPPPPLAPGVSGAIQAAEREVGVPYVWGGASPSTGFDCSGLIMWAYAQVGIGLPHFSGAQFASTIHIPLSAIQPGDLLFFGPQGADHEAMYLGGGQMIEAPHAGASVRIVGVRTDSSTVVGRVQ